MFVVPEDVAKAVRRTYQESGEFAAAVELRRHFPGIVGNENARHCARMIAGWTAPAAPAPESKPRAREPAKRRKAG